MKKKKDHNLDQNWPLMIVCVEQTLKADQSHCWTSQSQKQRLLQRSAAVQFLVRALKDKRYPVCHFITLKKSTSWENFLYLEPRLCRNPECRPIG